MGDEQARRSVVPKPVRTAAHGSPWLAAVWTGLGAAVVCATLAIVVVAACWLPVSGTTGRTNSAIRAGLLTFLAGLHGGITVDGVSSAWLPLGMLAIVGLTAWRAGSGLADAADALEEHDPARLALAGFAQVVSFTVGCLVAVPFATLGTSRAPFFGVALGAATVFAVTGTVAFVRSSPLREWCAHRLPNRLPRAARAAATATAVYLLAGAAMTAGSLLAHHDAAERLSRSVGGGAGGIPLLILGVLAAPNAMIAASAYLAGPGFAIGTGTHVSLFDSTHGTLPAFPILAAIPTGPANPAGWTLAAGVPLLAGTLVARQSMRAEGWLGRLGIAASAAAGAGVLMFLLAWQGGGAVGDGRLQTVG
ncbi:MAG: cell division protein PerM, partial [Jatrophihabitantaceae bacterium]